jgi:SpoVK/Ycf46/Vps4 family AAA+-type ATPase
MHQVTQQQSQQDEYRAVLRLEPIAMLHDSAGSRCRPSMTLGNNMETGAAGDDSSSDFFPPWRRPDICGNATSNLVVAPSICGLTSMEKDILTRLDSAVSSGTANGNLPVGVGSILPLSWTSTTDQENNHAARNKFFYHYRLVMEKPFKKDVNNEPADVESMFFFARDLPKLLRASLLLRRQAEQVDGSGSATAWTESKSPQLPINLLPCSTIVPASLVEGRPMPSSMSQCSALICGDSGSGKTHSALVLATVAQLLFAGSRTIYLNCRRLKDTRGLRIRDILAALDDVFKEIASTRRSSCSPATLILDDLDEIAPNHESDSVSGVDDSTQVQQVNPLEIEQAKMISDHLFRLMHVAALSQSQDVGIIITCSHEASIPRKLLSCRSFKNPIKLPVFSNQERECLFLKAMQQYNVTSCMDRKFGTERLHSIDFASRTETFSPRDIKLLSCRVRQLLRSSSKDSEISIESTVALVLESFVPANRQSASLERTNESAGWDDVGGLSRAKEELIETILRPSLYRRIYQKARMRLPRGVLLFGPTGCGKSFLVPALAKKCRLPLIMCRGPELLDKYIGASEAKVRELFSRAAAAAPSILFLDELDSLAPRRGSDHTGVTDRVVNQLLTFLDGVEDTQGGGTVYILAATSRPDKVDPALLRPGRLERHVYVGFPERVEDLTDVLVKMTRHYNVDKTALDEQVASGELAKKALALMGDAEDNEPRLSPADIKAMMNTAQIAAVRDALPVLTTTRTPKAGSRDSVHTNEKREEVNTVCLEAHHLHEALRSTRPSLSKQEWGHLRQVYSPFLPGRNVEKNTSDGLNKPPAILRTALK